MKTKFIIKYNEKNLNYYGKSMWAKKLFEELLKSSNNRCMYCGENLERLNTDFKALKILGIQLEREHTVERRIMDSYSIEKLTECKYNFSISYHQCNIAKRKDIKISEQFLEKLNLKKCGTKCKKACKEYSKVLEEYKKNNKIITMPKGLKYDEDIVYNCETLLFEINEINEYSSEERRIINNHIEVMLSPFQRECLDDVLSDLLENGCEDLPNKKTNFYNKNKFKSVIADNFLDALADMDHIKRKMTILKIQKKIQRSLGIKI